MQYAYTYVFIHAAEQAFLHTHICVIYARPLNMHARANTLAQGGHSYAPIHRNLDPAALACVLLYCPALKCAIPPRYLHLLIIAGECTRPQGFLFVAASMCNPKCGTSHPPYAPSFYYLPRPLQLPPPCSLRISLFLLSELNLSFALFHALCLPTPSPFLLPL